MAKTAKPAPTAYSYVRFSTPDQAEGDSERRQIQDSRDYARRHGLKLDETLTFLDRGISSYRGQNIREGQLHDFIKAVESSKIKRDSYLLVENFDRLSRESTLTALDNLRHILQLGITVVTLNDGRVHTKENIDADIGSLFTALLSMHTANEESKKKSERLGKAWSEKRRLAATESKPLTGVCPAWMTLDKNKGKFKLIPDRVVVIRRIFKEASHGVGHHTIATKLNKERVPGIGRTDAWHGSYIQKILNNTAAIGQFQPHKLSVSESGKRVRVPDGEVIEHYYPAAIPAALFYQVRDQRTSRRQIPSGPRSRRDGSPVPNGNLFTGLLRCKACASSMNFVNKGTGSKGGYYLVCSNARRGRGCEFVSWNYMDVEEAILHTLAERINWVSLLPQLQGSAQEEIDSLLDEQGKIRSELEHTEARIQRFVEALGSIGLSEAVKAGLRQAEEKKRNLEDRQTQISKRLNDERRRLASSEVTAQAFGEWTSKHSVSRFRADMKPAQAAERQRARNQLAQVLRERVEQIVMYPRSRNILVLFNEAIVSGPGIMIPFAGWHAFTPKRKKTAKT